MLSKQGLALHVLGSKVTYTNYGKARHIVSGFFVSSDIFRGFRPDVAFCVSKQLPIRIGYFRMLFAQTLLV